MSYCGQRTIVNDRGTVRQAATLRCKSWGCPDCAPNRQRRLMAECCGGNPTSFLTLTIRRGEAATPDEAARKLSHAWRDLRRLLCYWRGIKKIPFLAIFERHKSGWPHLHIFVRMPYVPQAELSCWMSWLVNSPIVDISQIKSKGQAASYAAKYVTKDNVKFKTAKRYWQSQDWDLREPFVFEKWSDVRWGTEIIRLGLEEWIAQHPVEVWMLERPRHGVAVLTQRGPP